MARATSSLPLPFSPVISTRASVGATRSMTARMFLIAVEVPNMRSLPLRRSRMMRFSLTNCFFSVALRTSKSKRWRSGGFSTKSNAPRFVASTAVSIVPCPLIIMIGTSGLTSFSLSSVSSPSMPGILTSSKIQSINVSAFWAMRKPSTPLSAVVTECCSYSKIIASVSRMPASSSTIRMCAMSSC